MKRREFIKGALAASVASVLPHQYVGAKENCRKRAALSDKFVTEQERQIPVCHQADVVVCGGGPAGIGAAIEAARNRAKVVLVEHAVFLGGTWTSGLLGVMLGQQTGHVAAQCALHNLRPTDQSFQLLNI